jgi:hypothetical protein
MDQPVLRRRIPNWVALPLLFAAAAGALTLYWTLSEPSPTPEPDPTWEYAPSPRAELDDSGLTVVLQNTKLWADGTSLEQVRDVMHRAGRRLIPVFDAALASGNLLPHEKLDCHIKKATLLLYEGEPAAAYDALARARAVAESHRLLSAESLSTVQFLQGVAGLRLGEDENCVECRGEGACIFPIAPSAVHQRPTGSRRAVKHFTEYLARHPDDLGARWLLNVAHMTLGEHPSGVDPRQLIPLEHFRSAFDIGRFQDVAHLAGVNRFNQAGGAIMEDFDGDGLLDLVVTSWDPAVPMAYYRNKGDGTFEERGRAAGVGGQLGGLYCVQTDYDNDGRMDVFVVRGAWVKAPVRPSLLRNDGGGTFTDVTREAGLLKPVNAITAAWADYDNDGRLDVFVGCDHTRSLLYRNKGDGTFEEVGDRAGVSTPGGNCKGASWGDFDGDGWPDLFLNFLNGPPALYRNNGDGSFTDVAAALKLTAPAAGFSCWFWDYDNDGWPDIYATGYLSDVSDVIATRLGRPSTCEAGALYRNLAGKGFEDVTARAGLRMVMSPMGTNFADFDNDGFLDFYLGTGQPRYSALIPNRMFKNVAGERFAEITTSSGTGHLQKGHAVACGDWDRDGDLDLFVQVGGSTPGDRFRNALFQNPGQGNNWLSVKLIGVKSNRAAIGARLKAVTAGPAPRTVYRHVTSGSSFGANPLEQTLGLGGAERLALLEVYWPTTRTTQVFRDLPANQAIEITEFAANYRRLDRKRLPSP